jgi:hypothetical protein
MTFRDYDLSGLSYFLDCDFFGVVTCHLPLLMLIKSESLNNNSTSTFSSFSVPIYGGDFFKSTVQDFLLPLSEVMVKRKVASTLFLFPDS